MNTLHVNVGLARYSDWAFTSAVVALVVALLLLAFEFAQVRGRGLGDEPGQAGQVDELVHVAPRHPLGGQAAQHDARQQ